MRLTFLGTGSAMPTPDRHQTGLLIETEATRLLLDCGAGVLHRLAATDGGYESLDGVFLTHHHLDHLSDLLPLLKARWLAGSGPLPVAGPPGTTALLESLLDLHDYLADRVAVEPTDIDPNTFSLAGIDTTAMETRHSMPCYAYRLAGPEGDVVYSGDTEAFEGLASFAEGASVLVHDCSFPDGLDVSNHPTPSAIAAVLEGHDCGTVYLTHLYPQTAGHHDEMLTAIRARYDGPVRIARDGLTVTI